MALTAPGGKGGLLQMRGEGPSRSSQDTWLWRVLFATARVRCWSPKKGSRGKDPSFRTECSGMPELLKIQLSAASKLTKAGKSWKQLTACSRPSPHVPPYDRSWQNQYSSIMDSAVSWERALPCLEGRREGLSDAKEDTVYPFKLSMPRRQWPWRSNRVTQRSLKINFSRSKCCHQEQLHQAKFSPRRASIWYLFECQGEKSHARGLRQKFEVYHANITSIQLQS